MDSRAQCYKEFIKQCRFQGINVIKDLLENVGNYIDSRNQCKKDLLDNVEFKGSML